MAESRGRDASNEGSVPSLIETTAAGTQTGTTRMTSMQKGLRAGLGRCGFVSADLMVSMNNASVLVRFAALRRRCPRRRQGIPQSCSQMGLGALGYGDWPRPATVHPSGNLEEALERPGLGRDAVLRSFVMVGKWTSPDARLSNAMPQCRPFTQPRQRIVLACSKRTTNEGQSVAHPKIACQLATLLLQAPEVLSSARST